ncbi:MAG: HDIG domain-containing protein [candidate division KSB1 bacterium]|nr:HDIG domain-containing protein [candidate division KSB1 bacterium]
MTREEALAIVRPRFSNANLFKHVLAVEAVMRELAEHFHQDVEQWGLIGLLHDLDYEETMNQPERHTLVTEELLKPYQLPDEIITAIKGHNNMAPRETLAAKALYAADPVTGLIVAGVLMHPERRLASVDADFILRRFKEKSFARGADRDQIRSCEQIGLTLPEFITLAINGMRRIADQLGF